MHKYGTMKDESIQAASVKKQIKYFESLIEEKRQEIEKTEKSISMAKWDIQVAQNTIEHLKSCYKIIDDELTTDKSASNATLITSKISNKKQMGLQKKQMIMDTIKASTSLKGIMIPEIKEFIKEKHNVNISSATIDVKIRDLINEGHVKQVNEKQARSRRYLAISKDF